MTALSPPLARALEKRLNAVTPWHVRVRVFVRPNQGYAYKIQSLSGTQSGEARGLEWNEATNDVLHSVQSFMANRTN